MNNEDQGWLKESRFCRNSEIRSVCSATSSWTPVANLRISSGGAPSGWLTEGKRLLTDARIVCSRQYSSNTGAATDSGGEALEKMLKVEQIVLLRDSSRGSGVPVDQGPGSTVANWSTVGRSTKVDKFTVNSSHGGQPLADAQNTASHWTAVSTCRFVLLYPMTHDNSSRLSSIPSKSLVVVTFNYARNAGSGT